MDFAKFDVIIVGGGPIGGIAARTVAAEGLTTIILEEHGEIGRPEHCAGLLSKVGLRRLGVSVSKKLVLNSVKGAIVFSPSGSSLTVERQSEQACVVNRSYLDEVIIGEATKVGSTLSLNAKARLIETASEPAVISAEMSEGRGLRRVVKLRSGLVISCVGALANLSDQVGLDNPDPRMRLYGAQYEMSNVGLEREDIVQIYLGRRYAPGFFAWIIPTGVDSARVGLASKSPRAFSYLKYFISHHPIASKTLARSKINKSYGGLVLTGGPIRQTFSDRFLATGDCAGQTKPTTGGGVVTGGICAKMAGETAVESVEAGDFSRGFLSKYQSMWKRELGREFSAMLKMRRLLNLMPDAIIDRVIDASRRSGLADLMMQEGDVDFQSRFIEAAVKSPRIIISAFLSFLGFPFQKP